MLLVTDYYIVLCLISRPNYYLAMGQASIMHYSSEAVDKVRQVHSARSSLVVIHPCTNGRRRALTSVNMPCTELALVATVTVDSKTK